MSHVHEIEVGDVLVGRGGSSPGVCAAHNAAWGTVEIEIFHGTLPHSFRDPLIGDWRGAWRTGVEDGSPGYRKNGGRPVVEGAASAAVGGPGDGGDETSPVTASR